MIETAAIIFGAVALIVSLLALGLSLWAVISSESMKRSTHTLVGDMASSFGGDQKELEKMLARSEMDELQRFEITYESDEDQ